MTGNLIYIAFLFTLSSRLALCHSPLSRTDTLTYGSSLSVDNSNDVLISTNGVFSAGFYQVGENAFCFAIWFTMSNNNTVTWMANKDQPVIAKHSILKLKKNGNLKLKSLGNANNELTTVWSSNTISDFPLQLQLLDTGNLVLRRNNSSSHTVWQSFDSPTNTLLPSQLLTSDISLISSRSTVDYSSGLYKLFYGKDDVLNLAFEGPMMKPCNYFVYPRRSTHLNRKIARLDSYGYLNYSEGLVVSASDLGLGPQRRLTLDFDGNLRMYSLQEDGEWEVVWTALQEQCKVHGLCGDNSLCRYEANTGRRCTCLPGYKLKNSTDWLYGCEPEFDLHQPGVEFEFVQIPYSGTYTSKDIHLFNYTLRQCESECRGIEDCKGFVMKMNEKNGYICYLKKHLVNGYQSPNSDDVLNMKVPKNTRFFSGYNTSETYHLNCDVSTLRTPHQKKSSSKVGPLGFLIWFAVAIGSIEMTIIFCVWCCILKYHDDDLSTSFQGYFLAVTGFRRYSYKELRRVTSNFQEEIGRGGSSVVYKGLLADGRTVAVKRLENAEQCKEEFLAEMSTIGRIKHMNLMETLGYCVEGKHRILVFEFMEKGSLTENLSSNSLDWKTRYKIALGTARGLAYLHEECLEWVLHCDVKPQNVLLDSNFEPKVGDFGLSKLLKRSRSDQDSNFSRIRGTRGYMAPEWVSNAVITSKVDVYSYGVVALEIVTGKTPAEVMQEVIDARARDRKENAGESRVQSWVEENADTIEMRSLALVALQCVQEDKDARPTMKQVVDMLEKKVNIELINEQN